MEQAASDLMEFKMVSNAQYAYDANGRMIADPYKKIMTIEYNFVNLPRRITFQNGNRMEYIYDATGTKFQKKYLLWVPGNMGVLMLVDGFIQNYAANKIYYSGTLTRLLTQEGYVDNSGTAYSHYYYLKDYQGNNRMVLNSSGGVEQATNYYAFGASYAEKPARTDQWVQDYKFGGKELDRMFGLDYYDYSARTYDPISSRFLTPDPLAEKYPWLSPYAYCANNPVRFVDPTGMWIQYRDSTTGDSYRYNNGQWEQYQTTGKNAGQYTAYTPASGSFLEGVLNGLNALAKNSEAGKTLLDYFANDNNDVYIKQGTQNEADLNSHDIFLDTNFKGSPIPTENGTVLSPFWLDVGHELAHQQDVQKNGYTQANSLWLTLPNGKIVPSTEKYATHIENQMRADAGLPLRTYYVGQGFGGYASSQILINGVSKFYGTNYRLDAISRRLNHMFKLRIP